MRPVIFVADGPLVICLLGVEDEFLDCVNQEDDLLHGVIDLRTELQLALEQLRVLSHFCLEQGGHFLNSAVEILIFYLKQRYGFFVHFFALLLSLDDLLEDLVLSVKNPARQIGGVQLILQVFDFQLQNFVLLLGALKFYLHLDVFIVLHGTARVKLV